MQTARSMHQDIDRVLVTKKQIADRVSEMAEELSSELMNIEADSEIVLLPIMNWKCHLCCRSDATVANEASYRCGDSE